MTRQVRTPEVLVVGGGPSGLTAAAELARAVTGEIVVLDREPDAGGIPRHSEHTGYGVRDLHRMTTGPRYARRLAGRAVATGAQVVTSATVTGWSDTDALALDVTTPQGLVTMRPRAVVLATGARERPRSARLVPGDRPAGVLTTGQVQNLVHNGLPVGTRAVVVGSELVSWSAVLTMREAGCATVLMITENATVEAPRSFAATRRFLMEHRVSTRTSLGGIIGSGRVESVEIRHLDTQHRRIVDCDTVVFTGSWVPDHELARLGGLAMDRHTRGPEVDAALRTSRPGVFAVGNLVHPVDTADVAALDGRHVAGHVREHLAGAPWPDFGQARLRPGASFAWACPTVIRPRLEPSRGRLLVWPRVDRRRPVVVARQGDEEVGRLRVRWPCAVGRVFRVPWALLEAVDPSGPDVTVDLA